MEQEGERLSADINFPKVLFLHINRVAQSQNDDMFAASVEMLESLLFPYEDSEYRTDLKIPEQELRNIANLDGSTHGKEGMVSQKHSLVIRQKFRALMKLAHRRNLLIQREAEGYDSGNGDAEGYDAPEEKV